jgi:hypothetical protein
LHPEAQRVALPGLLVNRDQRSELAVGMGQALFDATQGFQLPEAMADDDGDGIAHGNVINRARSLRRARLSLVKRGRRVPPAHTQSDYRPFGSCGLAFLPGAGLGACPVSRHRSASMVLSPS